MTDSKLNVLVTGAGGDIAQSIVKILRKNSLFSKIIGTDIYHDHIGQFFFDKSYTISKSNSPTYFNDLTSLVAKYDIHIIIPTSEPEQKTFLKEGIMDKLGDAHVILANKKSMEIGFDKYKTALFLKKKNLPYPKTFIAKEVKEPFFPAIMKDRQGSGSKSITKIYDNLDFNYYVQKFPHYIYQQLIGNDESEYTCGLFKSKTKGFHHIIFRRKLKGDVTGTGVVVKNKHISQLLEAIADNIMLNGSINVQLRLVNQVPYVFEINPRFSSTVHFRDLVGFNDLLWSIYDKMGLAYTIDDIPAANTKIYRGYQEFVSFSPN